MTQCAFGPGFLINFITEELMHCFPTDALGYQRTCTAGLRPLLSPTRCWAYFGKQKALPTVLSLRGKPTVAPLPPHVLGIQRGVPNPSPRELLALTACLTAHSGGRNALHLGTKSHLAVSSSKFTQEQGSLHPSPPSICFIVTLPCI